MTSFIEEVVADIKKRALDLSNITFVLPSKRAGVFLKHHLAKQANKSMFLPKILSIETFVESLSGLQQASNTVLLFELYQTYTEHTPEEDLEPFENFSKWGQLLLQDFNELDRFLVAPDNVFDYLSNIKELEHNHWSLEENATPHIKQYLKFWKRLKTYYHALSKRLMARGKGYQGLVYRDAVAHLESYLSVNKTHHVFLGFNALNKAEETIIQELLQQEAASIYWDIDGVFINNPIHDAGHFIRTHKIAWPYYAKHPFNWEHQYYQNQKQFKITGAPKSVAQVKYVGTLLQEIYNRKKTLKNTAVVLGEEHLLLPLLSSLPKNVGPINITMGLALHNIPLATLFENLFRIHAARPKNYYHKDVFTVLTHPFIHNLIAKTNYNTHTILAALQANNTAYVTTEKLEELAGPNKTIIGLLFGNWDNNPKLALKNSLEIIQIIKTELNVNKHQNLLSLEYLYRFYKIFNELNLLTDTYPHVKSIKSLHGIYKDLLKSESLDFQGEAQEGLQIMGMLETRAIDFETVILTSVNEGVLPSGKSQNSFIPFDVKLKNKLPTYKEKDAVYTYHFYRLLQRAKTVHILYNTEPDVLNGGEKSRFISQLEAEAMHPLEQQVITAPVKPNELLTSTVKKTPEVIKRLQEIALKGFSPSSLTNYVRNPIDFYSQKILGVKPFEDLEETVAANTLGTTVHNTLEDLYKPYVGQYLQPKDILKMQHEVDALISLHFKEAYPGGDISKGKNLIIFEVAKQYVTNFLNLENKDLLAGNAIKIEAVEADLKVKIPIKELEYPVFLTGKVDRIDQYNGTTRIIDYKTGKVESRNLNLNSWEDLITDYDKGSKPFQILTYAYMLNTQEPFSAPVEAGIISFKNLGAGVLKFTENKSTLITQDILDPFYGYLKQLILEICDSEKAFEEKVI